MMRSVSATSGQRHRLSWARRSPILLPLAPNQFQHRRIEQVRSPDTPAEDPSRVASYDRTLALSFCRSATEEFREPVFRNRARPRRAFLLPGDARDWRTTDCRFAAAVEIALGWSAPSASRPADRVERPTIV